MVRLPEFLAEHITDKYLYLDEFSCCAYNPETGRDKIQVLLTRNLLAFIIKGKKIIHHGEEEIVIQEGEAFFARKGFHLLSDKMNFDNEYRSFIFFMDDAFLARFHNEYSYLFHSLKNEESCPPVFPIRSAENSGIESMAPLILDGGKTKKALLKIHLQEILVHLLESSCGLELSRVIRSTLNPVKKDLVQFMHENFMMPVNLKDFAAQSNRSLSSFKVDFNNAFHQSPMSWIKERRLDYALNLLKSSDMPITEICFESGFKNLSHFIQQFKHRYQKTPKQIRKSFQDSFPAE